MKTSPIGQMTIKVSLGLLVVLITGVFCVVLPLRKTFALRQALHEEGDQIAACTLLLAEFKDPPAQLKLWEEQLKNLDQRFPNEQTITFVLQQLGDKSKELGLEILNESPVVDDKAVAPGSLPSKYERKKIFMELKCGYETLGKYLAAIATLPTFFSVEELNVASNPAELPMLNVRIVLAFYVTKMGA